MVSENIQISLTLTQQMTLSKLKTRLDALKVERDEILQEIEKFIQLSTIELGVPQGTIFDLKSMTFTTPKTKPQQTPE